MTYRWGHFSHFISHHAGPGQSGQKGHHGRAHWFELIKGSREADEITGTEGTDWIHAFGGDDVIDPGAGDDIVDGGRGFDTVVYAGAVADYEVILRGNHWCKSFVVKSTNEMVADAGTDFLKSVEALYFAGDDYTLYMDGTNNAVLAGDDAAAGGENEVIAIAGADLLANDREFDGDTIVITAVDATSTAGASVSFDGTTVSYDPGAIFDSLAEGEVATDTFTYTVDDGLGGSDVATVTVTITGVNDAPVITAASTTIDENTTAVDLGVSALDVDSAALTFSLSGADAALFTIDPLTGAVAFIAAPDFEAPGDADGDNAYELTVTATDDHLATDSADVTVTVADVNEVPPVTGRINEFHYDNAGSDVGEFVELRFAAGDDVSQVLVEFYNGNNGAVYNSFDLTALTPTSDGTYDYYVIDLPANGLQNGSPDGIALSNGGAVIEFLSYEGTMDATDGTAAGMTSTDIGVAESSSNPIGFSLQRNDDGTWREAEAETKGAENVPVVETAQIVITEIMQNPAAVADSAGEYFELYNAGSADVDINGWVVSDNDSDSFTIDNGGPLIIPAGGYIVLGNNGDSATNGGVPVDYEYSGMFLSNGADELVLTDLGGNEIDRVEWDGGPNFPDPNGASMELISVDLDNNVGANWEAAEDVFGDGDLGTPGGSNAPIDARINEFHYDNAGSDVGEFIEVRVAAGGDASGLVVELYNGNGGAVYATYALGGITPTTDGTYDYYVLDLPANGMQNGGPDGLALSNSGELIEFLSYEGTMTGVGGAADGVTSEDIGVSESSVEIGFSLQRNDDGTWRPAEANTSGAANTGSGGGGGGGGTGTGATDMLISAIQGSGAESAFVGDQVRVSAIVTHVTADGFYLQEEDADSDGDAATSEGIYVFTSGGYAVTLGDLVEVTGNVTEFFGLTEINAVSDVVVVSSGNVMPTAASILLDPSVAQDFEAVEGMLVSVSTGTPDPLTVIENFNFDRYGEIVVSAGTQTQATQLYDAQTQAAEIAAHNEGNENARLLLDDGNGSQNPDEFVYVPGGPGDDGSGYLDANDDFSDTGSTLRLGAEIISPIEGVMSYGFSEYRLVVTETLDIDESTNSGARTDSPTDVGGSLQVASYNVLNYFSTIDGTGTSGPNNLSPRGADSVDELVRQTEKLVAGITATGAEVFALQEIENNGFGATSAIQTLTDALNDEAALLGTGKDFQVVDPTGTGGFVGNDAIMTGIIYDANAVTLLHAEYLVYAEPSADATYAIASTIAAALGSSFADNDRNRPSTAATFQDNATGETFTVVSSHFKSKGSSGLESLVASAQAHIDGGGTAITQAQLDALLADPNVDQGDGQGYWNAVRLDAATELADWIANSYNGGGTTDYLLLGDMNAYAEEDPVQYLDDDAGLADLIDQFIGQDEAYSYVFDGQQGTLDQGFGDAGILDNVTGVTEWHINADEPDLLNYDTSFKNPLFYNDGVYASSDHDPLIVGLDFTPFPVG